MNNIRHFPFKQRKLEDLLDGPGGKRLINDIFKIGEDMATVNEAQNINTEISNWDHKQKLNQAQDVINWVCGTRGSPMKDDNGKYTRPVLVKAEYLAAAMSKQKFWMQAPADYLDMFDAIQAVLELIPEQKEL